MPVRRSSNHIPSSAPMKQGIVTILGADCHRINSKAGSIRRTLSADMSSKKWLEQNGFFSPMKKIVSSQEIVMAADHSDEEEFRNQDEVWRSIQAQKEKNELQKPAQSGVWGLILTQKSENSLLQTPYVHPMVKRSSSLTHKSLEICTESLGSETGSDCFSCHEASSDGDHEEREENRQRSERGDNQVKGEDPFADLHVVKYKKSPAMPFPPPLPSIAAGDGPSLHMHSRRENGRLVLEAVSVAPRNYFHAQRQNGRLLLTLKHAPANLEFEEEEEEKVQFDDMEAAVDENVVDRGGGAAVVERKCGGIKEESLVEQNLSLPTGMISVHKSVLMKKLMVVGNINPKWSDNVVTRDGEDELLPIPQSLPPRRPPVAPRLTPPAAASAASFNAYEYFWRSKPGFMTSTNKNKMNQDDLVMYMRGCKEARRSLLWAPYCIATS